MKRSSILTVVILQFLIAPRVLGADWPQYRYDASRSAASPQQLPAELHLQWVRELPPPRPAFPVEVRLRFDASYEPVVLGKAMFVPSMVSDSLTALDTETGGERWRFFVDGPVRFAPVAWQQKVYFVSDDGYLYCLDAGDGTLRWKFRGLPAGMKDRKLLGNGRLISLWPARGGPVLADGTLYFAAGLWPAYGVFIYALDAESGKVLWSNTDSNRIPKANMDHGIAQYAGLTPQGYLAVVNEKLVVPCGAQLPAFLNLKTGALETYCTGWGGRNGLPKGTWFVAGAGKYLSHGGDLYDVTRPNDERFQDPQSRGDFKSMLYAGGFTRVRIDPTNQKDLGVFRKPVLAEEVMYENDRGIVAYDLTQAELQQRSTSEIPEHRRDDKYPDKWKAIFPELWRLPSKLTVHIKAGERLYSGGPGVVEAVSIPQRGEKPKVIWRTNIQGTPQRMLAADGKLFVVTREGRIYAFGGRQKAETILHARPSEVGSRKSEVGSRKKAAAAAADQWTEKAAGILRAAKVTDGYALVLGVGTGRLLEELVRQSELYVIAVDPDPGKVAELRQRLHRAGLYGTRATVHVGDPLSYPFPPYMANLIVSEDLAAVGPAVNGAFVAAVYPRLRPYGGTACLAISAAELDALNDQLADEQFYGLTVRQAGSWVLLSRPDELPGSADWSHPEADAANTGASKDMFVKAPLALLWFDAPMRWIKTPGATMVRVAGGRVFVKAQKLHAIDCYTGRQLWATALPFPHSPQDQLVAVDDAIYVTGGKTCLIVDTATGRKMGQIDLPGELPGGWSNLRIWGDYLVGQSGKYVVCMDRPSGELAWKYECGRPNLSIAVGGGKVFCAELINKRRGEDEKDATTRAFDVTTGKLLWQLAGGSELRYSEPADLLVTASGVYRGNDATLLAKLPDLSKVDPRTPPENLPKPLCIIGPKLLWGTVESFVVRDLQTGSPSGDTTTWVRRGCTGVRASSNLVTIRYRANAAYVDLDSRSITSLWNVRPACNNNLFPADGVLNMPNLTGGCTCNYTPNSQAYVPTSVIEQAAGD